MQLSTPEKHSCFAASWNSHFKYSLSFNLDCLDQGWAASVPEPTCLFRWILDNLPFPKIVRRWHTPNNGENTANYRTHQWENLQLWEVTRILLMSTSLMLVQTPAGTILLLVQECLLRSQGLFHRNNQGKAASTSPSWGTPPSNPSSSLLLAPFSKPSPRCLKGFASSAQPLPVPIQQNLDRGEFGSRKQATFQHRLNVA